MADAQWEAEFEAHRFDDEQHADEKGVRLELAEEPAERAARLLLAAFRASFITDATELTDSVLRTIGNSYQSCVERRLSAQLDMTPAVRRLRDAMEVYVAYFPEHHEALFGPEECPF